MAVRKNRYDRFAIKYFKYSGGEGYVFKNKIKTFNRDLRVYEQGRFDDD